MISAEKPENEYKRIADLQSYNILDTLPEEDYDNITLIASQICNTPISLLTMVDNDRQWFKSRVGLDAPETPREYAFCAHAINEPAVPFIVEDSRSDNRFHNNPLVTGLPNVIFYAGVPLVNPEGSALGTLCVIDNKPKTLSTEQLDSLKALAKQVMNLLELRKSKMLLENALKTITQKNNELDKFASTVAHDIKSPLAVIMGYSQILLEEYSDAFGDEETSMLQNIDTASNHLNEMVNSILSFSKNTEDLKNNKSTFLLSHLLDKVENLVKPDSNFSIKLNSKIDSITTNHTVLEQVLINLATNAIKYNDKAEAVVNIRVTEEECYYHFAVEDNGVGISPKDQERIFDIFETATTSDRFGNKGTGIGLATVKKLINAMDGSIRLESEPGKGSCFFFKLKK